MKSIFALPLMAILAACGAPDANTMSATANFQGDDLKVIWSVDSSKKATIIVGELGVDSLPVDAIETAAFRSFFNQVTHCQVSQDEQITVTNAGGRPFSILVPYAC